MAKAPRDYASEYRAYLLGRGGRIPTRKEPGGYAGLYLRRMAGAQERAEAQGARFVPQRARGHQPGEHIPRRAAQAVYRAAKRDERQERWVNGYLDDLAVEDHVAFMGWWDAQSPQDRARFMRAIERGRVTGHLPGGYTDIFQDIPRGFIRYKSSKGRTR